MFRFQHIEYLWLLCALPVAGLLYLSFLRWRKRRLKRLGDPALIGPLLVGQIKGRPTTRFLLCAAALFFAVIGLANLQQGAQTERAERKGLDVFFALDVSKSMWATDVGPTRLERAKQLIGRMIDKMSNDRVGLVVFAGKAYLQVPLTIDYGAAKMLLETVGPDMVPTQGTILSEAIKLSTASFSQKEKKHKALLLISDGEDHEERALQEARKAAEQGVVIYTVGIGSTEGTVLKDPKTGKEKLDAEGNPVVTKLNEDILKSLAASSGGIYVHLSNTNQTAEQLVKAIGEMEGKSYGSVQFTDYESYFQYFIAAALLLLLIEWLLPQAKRVTGGPLAYKKERNP